MVSEAAKHSDKGQEKWEPPRIEVPEEISEAELFAWAMRDVQPISPQEKELPFERPVLQTGPPRNEDQEALQALKSLVKGESPFDFTFSEEYIESALIPAAKPLLRRLRKGDFSVEDTLDLHGMDREEARRRVEVFLLQAVQMRKGCVKIIHGRGHNSKENRAILKQLLQQWLATRRISRNVLAYASARPNDGGFGAVYVLLRGSPRRNAQKSGRRKRKNLSTPRYSRFGLPWE
jgi:DNA-nicking Smr family endonuclease